VSTLRYVSGARHEALRPGECTIKGAGERAQLHFCYTRTTDGKMEARIIPVRIGAPGPGYWGLTHVGVGEWQVNPSIQCLDTTDGPDGTARIEYEVWHQTPRIVGVPDGEEWQK
jgi:hypothetical protein